MNRIKKKHEKLIAKMALERGLINIDPDYLYWDYDKKPYLSYCSDIDYYGDCDEFSITAHIAEYLWWTLNNVYHDGEKIKIVNPVKNIRTPKQIISELRKIPRKRKIKKLIIK